MPSFFDPLLFSHALGPDAPRFALDYRPSCASTNTLLIESPPPDDGRVSLILTDQQTAGRGRRGRAWLSFGQGSLTFSALWRFPSGAPIPAGLSLVAGLAVARWLEGLGVEGVQLKWPNDVLILGAKMAGILVELMPGRGRTPAAVVGVGLNLHPPLGDALPELDYPVAWLGQSLASPLPKREALLAGLVLEMDALMRTYGEQGFSVFRQAWMQRHAFSDLPVRVQAEDQLIEGLCTGVDTDGALLLTIAGRRERILSGEVSLRAL
jgi:BirA family transcriptional regulator, biotin operon repressor / biotin---[acetyl-CoA-carboxylase] ligase